MFDVGVSELMVIAIVALVVIGPERLPRVARTAGLLFGRLQRYVNEVKSDIGREMRLEELKALQAEVQASADHLEHHLARAEFSAQTIHQELSGALNATSISLPTPTPAGDPAVATCAKLAPSGPDSLGSPDSQGLNSR